MLIVESSQGIHMHVPIFLVVCLPGTGAIVPLMDMDELDYNKPHSNFNKTKETGTGLHNCWDSLYIVRSNLFSYLTFF